MLESWGSKVSAMVVFVALTRLLDAKDFGLVALALFVVTLAQTLVKAGLAEAIVQRKDLSVEHVRAAFWTSTGLGVVLAGATALAAPLIASAFDEPRLASLVRVLSVNFVLFGVASVSQALLQRELEFRAIAVRSMLGSFLGGVAGIAAALAGAGVWALVVQNLVDQVTATVVLLRAAPPDLGGRPRRWAIADLMGFSARSLGIQLNNFAFRRADDVLIGWRLGSTQLGFYSVAYRLMRLVDDMVSKVLLNVAFPTFSRIQHDKARSALMLRDASRIAAAALCPVFVGMSLTAGDLIPVAFGSGWDDAVVPMRILSLVGMLQGVQYFSSTALKAQGRMDLLLRWAIANTILTVVAFFVAAPHGIVAVAAVYTALGYALSPVLPILVHRELDAPVRPWFGGLVPVLLACGVMAAAVLATSWALGDRAEVLRLVVQVPVGVAVYAFVLTRSAPDLLGRAVSLLPDRLAGRLPRRLRTV